MIARPATILPWVILGVVSCAKSGGNGDGSNGASDASGGVAPACEQDADCLACATPRDCGCMLASAAEGCPPTLDACFVDPCTGFEAACLDGQCVLRDDDPDSRRELPPAPDDVAADRMEEFALMTRKVRSVFPLDSRRLEEITALHPGNLTTRSMGFGTTVVRGFLPGRLGNAVFAVVGHEGVVATAEIKIVLHESTPASVATWTAAALGPNFIDMDDRSFMRTWNDARRVARMDEARRQVLGAGLGVTIPPQLSGAFSHLHSRFGGEVGSACGAAGSPTQTHLAFEEIDRFGDLDLIRSILRGPSPEGRIYAAKALLRRSADGSLELTPEDERAIAAIRDLDISIRSCSGCAPDETSIGADFLRAAR